MEHERVLSDDEFTVLMIAAGGESMIPIGRWERPVKALAERGLLNRLNEANYVITEAGRLAVRERDRQDDKLLADVINKRNAVVRAQEDAAKVAEKIAKELALLVKLSCSVTGDSPHFALDQWSKVIFDRAKELIDE